MQPKKTYFEEKVAGRLRAELLGGENPSTQKGDKLTHYGVRLYLQTENPDVQRVIYKLDPTYYDPVRESGDAEDNFGVSLTTYGDYPVTVEAQVGGEIVRRTASLSELLHETHGESNNPKIVRALQEIESH